jgi:hypothetical protein
MTEKYRIKIIPKGSILSEKFKMKNEIRIDHNCRRLNPGFL